ncbi:MAG TPA: hypothetical protein VGS08_04700 [Candidatus Saccharimonadales bacterium]|nr:hypothetical protein [Candidatus Saccharimonadales bacterium]
MSNNFRRQAAQKRAAVPQIDVESVKPEAPATPSPVVAIRESPARSAHRILETTSALAEREVRPTHLTIVDTTETPMNRGFFMYPSRHRQVAKDLVYIEDRRPWEIIEDALEEYVVRHYGREYKRR